MMFKDALLKNQMQVDDILFHIRQSKEWNPGDYMEILSLQTMDHPYSLTTHLVALLRNMTLLKVIILIFYILNALCIAALIAECATLLSHRAINHNSDALIERYGKRQWAYSYSNSERFRIHAEAKLNKKIILHIRRFPTG